MRRVGIERLAVVEIGAGAVMAEIAGGIDIRDAMQVFRDRLVDVDRIAIEGVRKRRRLASCREGAGNAVEGRRAELETGYVAQDEHPMIRTDHVLYQADLLGDETGI